MELCPPLRMRWQQDSEAIRPPFQIITTLSGDRLAFQTGRWIITPIHLLYNGADKTHKVFHFIPATSRSRPIHARGEGGGGGSDISQTNVLTCMCAVIVASGESFEILSPVNLLTFNRLPKLILQTRFRPGSDSPPSGPRCV